MKRAAAICARCPRTLRYFERSWCRSCRAQYESRRRQHKLRAAGLYPAHASALASGFLAEAA